MNPKLDLLLERTVDVPCELVWEAWTQPEILKKWFTPKPWETVDCEIDLRPGGLFRTVMRSPEGEEFPGVGCYLEIVENRKLSWTSVLGPGYRPIELPTDDKSCESLAMTAIITLEPHGSGTRYSALVLHADETSCKRHKDMGFHEGWGSALDQLVTTMTARR